MDWLNLKTVVLHSPEYIGSEPRSRATWLNVSLWCAQQENGGRIASAKAWKDRQWQQTCGVTLREVTAAAPLLVWDGDDLTVWNYPVEKEGVVRAKREAGRLGGQAKTEAKADASRTNGQSGGRPITQAETQATTQADNDKEPKQEPNGSGMGRGIGIGKEGEKEEEGAIPASPAPANGELPLSVEPSEPTGPKPKTPANMTDAEWLDSLRADPAFAGIDVLHEHAKATRWCLEHRKQLTRKRFINWLNRCDKPMTTTAGKSTFEQEARAHAYTV